MTTLKKSLKKNSSLKKNLKKNLSLKKSLKKNLKKVSGKENKSMRGGAWRPPRYRRPSQPPQTYKDHSMINPHQQYLGNFKTAGMSIPSAKRYNPDPDVQRLLPTPSQNHMTAYLARQTLTEEQKKLNPISQETRKAHAQIRDYLYAQARLARLQHQ